MSTSFQIEYRQETDGVAVLTLDRPTSKVNLLDQLLWDDLHRALKALRVRPGVAGLVLASAKPGAFVAGADLKWLGAVTQPNDPAVERAMRFGLDVLQLLETLPFPTCAAIDGAALGGGLEVALACDFRVVTTAPHTRLGLPELSLGLIPGWGGTQRLTRLCHSVDTALAMLADGTILTSEALLEANLADTLTDGDAVEEAIAVLHHSDRVPKRLAKAEALPLVEQELLKDAILERGPTEDPALRELYSVLVRGGSQPLRDALPMETAAFCRLAGSEAAKTKIAAFFASRAK